MYRGLSSAMFDDRGYLSQYYIYIIIYIHNHIYTKTRVWITIAIPNKGLFYWSGLSEGCLAAKCSTKY